MDTPAPESEQATYTYPFAPSPDIIRTHQKDAYLTSTLSSDLSSILRSLFGARFAHKHAAATTHLSELLYLSLTTLLGNRTLGEEYTDVLQVSDTTLSLPSLARRLGYILSSVFSPWLLARILPAFRRKLRIKLERSIARARQKLESRQRMSSPSKPLPTPWTLQFQEYILAHLDTITSLSPIYAISLAAFYFTSSYYHISKRLFGLRYIFTKKLAPDEQRVGYEVLGVLLLLQLAVQSTLHIRETFFSPSDPDESTTTSTLTKATQPVHVGPDVELPLSAATDPSSSHLLLTDLDLDHPHPPSTTFEKSTNTPTVDPNENPHYHLDNPDAMSWIPAGQQRKCTLCLEPFKDPSVTTCGHVFCWACVQDWVREKEECPLCRSVILGRKVLPLRG